MRTTQVKNNMNISKKDIVSMNVIGASKKKKNSDSRAEKLTAPPISMKLKPSQYEKLSALAEKRGLGLGTLSRVLLMEGGYI